jgi:hypothetical protein
MRINSNTAALVASNLKRSACEANLQPLTKVDSMNSSNPLNKVLPLCRSAVLQLDYLTSTLQNRSTAALGGQDA